MKTLFIQPNSPWKNGYIESFNGKLRDELLAGEQFDALFEAKVLIERWRREYKTIRPHSSLAIDYPLMKRSILFFPSGYAYRKERGWHRCGPNYTLEVCIILGACHYPPTSPPNLSLGSFDVKDYFSDSVSKDIGRKTVRGGLYTGIGKVLSTLIALGVIPILARLLQPSDFGLIAMMAVFTNFGSMFVDAGLSIPTIQRDKITHHQVSNLFWIATGLGCIISLLVCLSAPLVVWCYSEPRLFYPMLVTSISFVFSGLSIQHQALLHRQMMFFHLVVIGIVSSVTGQVAAIAWAYHYQGQPIAFWALVLMPIVTAAVALVGKWIACGWRPGLPKAGVGTRELVTFGANLTGFSLTNYVARYVDKMLIGWQWGDDLLGHYDRAYRIFLTPISRITGPFASVAVPALSRLTHDKTKLEKAYARMLRMLLVIICTLSICMCLHGDLIIALMLGSGWEPAIPIFQCLAIVGIFQPFCHTLTWIFYAYGKGGDVLKIGLFSAAIKCTSYVVGLPWGPLGVAFSYMIATVFLYTPIALLYSAYRSPIDIRVALIEFGKAQIIAIAVCAASLIARYAVADSTKTLQLIVTISVATLVWITVLLMTEYGRQIKDDLSMIRK